MLPWQGMLKAHSLNCIFECYSEYNQIHRKGWKIVLLRLRPLLAPSSLFVVSRQQRGDILTVQFMVLACKVYNLGLENFRPPSKPPCFASRSQFTTELQSSSVFFKYISSTVCWIQGNYKGFIRWTFCKIQVLLKRIKRKNNVACWNLLQVVYIKIWWNWTVFASFRRVPKRCKGQKWSHLVLCKPDFYHRLFFFANFETCHKEKHLSGRATCFSCNTLISIVCIACPGRHGLSELVYVLTISCLFSGSRFLALGLDLNQKKLCNHYLYHVWWFAKSKGTS